MAWKTSFCPAITTMIWAWGVANSLAGIQAGIGQVECTINGIGERAGNASLEEIVMALKTRKDYFDCDTRIDTKQIYRSSRMIQTITGVPVAPTKPIIGANAFAHDPASISTVYSTTSPPTRL